MARIVPSDIARLDLASANRHELDTLRLLQARLPDSYTVFHGVHWTREWSSDVVFGELDFVVVNRAGRALLIEQKNGTLEETDAGLFDDSPVAAVGVCRHLFTDKTRTSATRWEPLMGPKCHVTRTAARKEAAMVHIGNVGQNRCSGGGPLSPSLQNPGSAAHEPVTINSVSTRSGAVQIHLIHLASPVAVVVFLLLSGCTSGVGITVPQNDNTPPTLTLEASQPAGQNVTVSAGGSSHSLMLVRKSGALNLLAAARDAESGVQALEIWVTRTIRYCDASGICTTAAPGQPGRPQFESTSPKKNPGERTAESSILAQPLDLSIEISDHGASPGGSLTVSLVIWAVAVNHLGGRTRTPNIAVPWVHQFRGIVEP